MRVCVVLENPRGELLWLWGPIAVGLHFLEGWTISPSGL